MKLSDWIRGIACLAVCIAGTSWMLSATEIEAGWLITPAAVGRGDPLTLAVALDNTSASAIANVTLFVPLPLGADQWSAEVGVDGGGWLPYPANGLIALEPFPAFAHRDVAIRFHVELGAPARLVLTAQLLDASGVLLEFSGTANVLPSVDAGPDLIVDRCGICILDDTSITDGGGAIAEIDWTDHGAGGRFDDAHELHATYTPPASSGIFELTLTGTDADGGTSSDALRVRVNASPWVDAGADLAGNEGDELHLPPIDLGDADGWISEIQWSDGDAGGTFLPSRSVVDPGYVLPELSGCEDGTITLTVTVIDEWGAASSDTLTIHVRNLNTPPWVCVPDDVTATSGDTVTLTGAGFDEDGSIVSASWSQIGGQQVELTFGRDGQEVRWRAPDVEVRETLRFCFEAVDNCGAVAEDTVNVTVEPHPVPENEDTMGALSVRMDVLDLHGIPISPLDPPASGSTVTVRVSIRNAGTSTITGLAGRLESGEALVVMARTLGPWSSTSGACEWTVPSWAGAQPPSVRATVYGIDEHGRHVDASCAYDFVGNRDDALGLSLTLTASCASAGIGDDISFEYSVTNVGGASVSGLTLDDDRFGRIELPAPTLDPGETYVVHRSAATRALDLPGPLVHQAVARAFTEQGQALVAEASVRVDLTRAAGGGGAAHADERVVLSEIAWAGTPADAAAEWIELANLGTSSVNLDGWSIAWYEKTGEIPARETWREIELAGTIGPCTSSSDASDGVVFSLIGDGVWSMFDARWAPPRADGYFLLERGTDDVVANVPADQIYGSPADAFYDLPDAGAAVFLIDANGRLVDSANAQYEDRTGWIAGSATTGASMERVDVSRGDYASNWQTSQGMLTYGVSRTGDPLVGTAGQPNARPLDELLDRLESVVMPEVPAATHTVTIPGTGGMKRPMIHVTGAHLGSTAGGGGAIALPSIVTTRCDAGLRLTVDMTNALDGDYCIWIGLENGRGFVLSLRKMSGE